MNTPTVQTEAVLPQIDDDDEGTSLLELFHKLWFRRRLLFSTALFIIAVGVINLYQIEPRYTATSIILLGVPKTKVVDIEEVLSAGLGNEASIHGEVEVLRSGEIVKKVIEKFNLRSKEEFNPSLRTPGLLSHIRPGQWIPDQLKSRLKEILGSEPVAVLNEEERDRLEVMTAKNIFLGKLKINPVERSNVIKVSFESTNPKMAADIANELPEVYIIGQMEAKLEATKKATEWLNEQLSDLKKKVENSEQEVEFYREEYALTEVEGSRILGSQLLDVNRQLIIARAERAQAEARLRQLIKLQGKGGAEIESAHEVMSSSVIQRLRDQETSLIRKTSELSVQYGPKHTRIKQVNLEIEDVRGRIDQEIMRIVVGLKNAVEVALIREESLNESLMKLERESVEQTKESIRLNALEREATANRALFETFLTRFKETSSTSGIVEAEARVITKADIPAGASYPNKKKMLIMIIAGAFFAAIILVFLVQAFHQGLLSPEQVENELGLMVIGMIPIVPGGAKPYDYILENPYSSFAEALNSLETSLILCSPDKSVKTIQITSSMPREGKSSLAIAFSRILAKSGNKVILVDGDFRLSSLEKKLGITANHKGLTDLVMTSESSIEEFMFKDEKSGVFIMPKGGAKYVKATDVFSSHRMQVIIDQLKKKFDYVIIDAPPVMVVSDARVIGQFVDKTVFVVQWDKTPRKVIKAAIDLLTNSGIDITGCVLNQVNLQRYGSYSSGDSGYYYHYGRYGDYYTNK